MVDPCLRYPGTETLPKVHGQDIVHFIKLRFSSIKIWKGLWIFDWFNNLRQAVKLEHYHRNHFDPYKTVCNKKHSKLKFCKYGWLLYELQLCVGTLIHLLYYLQHWHLLSPFPNWNCKYWENKNSFRDCIASKSLTEEKRAKPKQIVYIFLGWKHKTCSDPVCLSS